MKLWKDNKIDEEFNLSNPQIAEGFLKSKWCRQPEHWPLERRLLVFIAAPEIDGGLSSVFEPKDGKDLDDICSRVLAAFKDGHEPTALERRLS